MDLDFWKLVELLYVGSRSVASVECSCPIRDKVKWIILDFTLQQPSKTITHNRLHSNRRPIITFLPINLPKILYQQRVIKHLSINIQKLINSSLIFNEISFRSSQITKNNIIIDDTQ